jgi:hypothetical protein
VLCRRPSTDVLVRLSPPLSHPNPLITDHSRPSSVTPTEGELFKRFSPELQKYNLENRERRQRDYEDFVGKLKEYSKSDKPSTSMSLPPRSAPSEQNKGQDPALAHELLVFCKDKTLTESAWVSMGSCRGGASESARGVYPAANKRCRIGESDEGGDALGNKCVWR